MKKIKITALVLLCIVTAGLCGIFAYGMAGHDIYRIGYGSRLGDNGFADAYGSPQLVLEKEVPLDGIDSISIQYNMNSNDIYLYESDNEYLTIKEYNELELADDMLSTVTVKGSSLDVKGKRRDGKRYQIQVGMFGMRTALGYTEIGLPPSYKGQLVLSTVSGDISSQMDIVLEKDFMASTSSGDVSAPLITAKNVTVKCTSGDVKVDTIQAETNGSAGEIHITTSSGDIDGKQFAGDAHLKSTSGDIEVDQFVGNADIQSSSGYFEAEAISGEAQIATTSGNISVRRIDGTVKLRTASGDVEVYEGSGGRTAKTTSGDVTLNGVDGVWDIETSSGGVVLGATKGSGRVAATSGDIRLEIGDLTGNLDMRSSSGYVNIKMSPGNAFDFRAETSSGDIDTFFDDSLSFSKKGNNAHGTYGENSDGHDVIIRTTSGDIRITK
ncbi:MAG: DUF4097 domain-containing protein [Lachnospiraceae bacterium]|nr:DUF4097 domain-containing protein [Lachnospiraceae bacterium]